MIPDAIALQVINVVLDDREQEEFHAEDWDYLITDIEIAERLSAILRKTVTEQDAHWFMFLYMDGKYMTVH